MDRLSVAQCRKLMANGGQGLSDAEVLRMREMLYTIGDVITDAYADLANIDQRRFEPYGDAVDQLNELGGIADAH
jgi:hypothetical protein